MRSLTRALATFGILAAACGPLGAFGTPPAYEVWAIDQADTAPQGGGTLYIFNGADLAGTAAPQPVARINLAEAALGVGDGVGKRPHMVLFNSTGTHAVIANVVSSHVQVIRASDRKMVASVKMRSGVGRATQAHAALFTPKDDAIIVANQNGKMLQRISADLKAESYRLDGAADLDLDALQDAQHPDNAPICPVFTSDGKYVVVTLRGGGAFLVDHAATPMKVVAGVGKDEIGPNGCGGLALEGQLWLNSGGGTPGTPTAYALYHAASPGPGTFKFKKVNSKSGDVDAHGAALIGKYIWMGDRFANLVDIYEATPEAKLVRTLQLASGPLSGKKPAPDLLDVSPDRTLAFFSLRGTEPLTANVPSVNNAQGNSPGILVVRVGDGGASGEIKMHVPLALAPGASQVDMHGIRVRVAK